jgi:hypothetical protein
MTDENDDSDYRDPSTGRLTKVPPWGFTSSEAGRQAQAQRWTKPQKQEAEASDILQDLGQDPSTAPAYLKRLALETAGGSVPAFRELVRQVRPAESSGIVGYEKPEIGERCPTCGIYNALPLIELRRLYDELAGSLPPRPIVPPSPWEDADRYGS